MNNDPKKYQFLRHPVNALIYIVGFAIYSMPSLRALTNSLLEGPEILPITAGFASQHALGIVISNVFIIIFRSFRINNGLKIGELSRIVENISLRQTVIRDFENRWVCFEL